VSLAEALEMAQAGRLADVEMAATPHPEPAVLDVREWPMAARVWLFKAGLGYPEIAKLGAYYHPPSKRVVLPTVDGLNTYWQARSVDGREPKYLGAQTGKALVVPKYGPQVGPVHVTEDILSAFKIGLAGARAWCALGTRLSAKFMADLMDAKQPARIWLDPDEGGRVGTSKIKKQLDAYGVPNETLLSREDPKRHTLDELRSIIGQVQ
jgi:DNA primase